MEPMERYLGLSPMMWVTGVPVLPDQAREIIRRTDRFFLDLPATDSRYLARVARVLGIPLWAEYERALRRNPAYRAYEANLKHLPGQARNDALCGEHYEAYRTALRQQADAHRQWLSDWGYIETEYVWNDWLASRFIYGPHGWCHPDGTIGHVDRVGKGQIAEEVYRDWCRLARAFPFLDLGVSLLRAGRDDGEKDEAQVSFHVRSGQVVLHDPAAVDVHAGHPSPTRGGPTSKYVSDQGDQGAEDRLASFHMLLQAVGAVEPVQVITWSWIQAWAARAPTQGAP